LLRTVFQNRNLTFLWLGQIISQSGDSIYQIGLLWLVLELSDSEAITGLVAMASYLPAVLLSLFAGVMADRGNRRQIMLGADAFRVLVVLMIPILHLTGHLTPFFLAINAFALTIAATFFNPARDAFIPQIVPNSGLMRANSLIQTSWQFALLLGPALAGVLLHLAGNVHLFTIDSIAYLLSFCFILLIRSRKVYNTIECHVHKLNDIWGGLKFVIHHRVLFPLLVISVVNNLFIMGPAIVGTPIFVKKELGLGAEAYALIMGCYAVGMLIGTVGLIWLGGRFRKGRILLVGMFFDGLTFIPIYWAGSLPALAVMVVIHSLAIPLLTVSRASLIQGLTPSQLTGRVFALVNLAVVGMTAVSAGLTGFVVEMISIRLVFLMIGIGGAFCGTMGWVFARKLKEV